MHYHRYVLYMLLRYSLCIASTYVQTKFHYNLPIILGDNRKNLKILLNFNYSINIYFIITLYISDRLSHFMEEKKQNM